MPRKKRSWQLNKCHHVMLRGIDGRPTFKDDLDRVRFLLLLQEASEQCFFRVHAFCLMTNHIHLIIEPTIEPLTVGVHRFASRYARHFNWRHLKRGYVFQGRFRSIIIQDGSYVRRLLRYIHLNPVEANLVTHPNHYRWSSYNAYLEYNEYTWLHKDRVLSHFGKNRSEAVSEMIFHTESKIDKDIDVEEINKSFRKGAFGNDEFVEIYAPTKNLNLNGQSTETKDFDIESFVSRACMKFGVTLNELRSSEKRRQLVHARAVLARAAQLKRECDVRMVCKVLQKHHGSISRLADKARKDSLLESIATLLAESPD